MVGFIRRIGDPHCRKKQVQLILRVREPERISAGWMEQEEDEKQGEEEEEDGSEQQEEEIRGERERERERATRCTSIRITCAGIKCNRLAIRRTGGGSFVLSIWNTVNSCYF